MSVQRSFTDCIYILLMGTSLVYLDWGRQLRSLDRMQNIKRPRITQSILVSIFKRVKRLDMHVDGIYVSLWSTMKASMGSLKKRSICLDLSIAPRRRQSSPMELHGPSRWCTADSGSDRYRRRIHSSIRTNSRAVSGDWQRGCWRREEVNEGIHEKFGSHSIQRWRRNDVHQSG